MPSPKTSSGISAKKSRRARIAVPAEQPRPAKPQSAGALTKTNAQSRLSALDAAAEVLRRLASKDAAAGLGVKDLIERMEKANLWQSPGGKTPSATLYSALIREIKQRKTDSRFKRIAPGKFSLAGEGRAARKPRAKSGTESVQ
ncbi:MAG: winged helix-turn-helix domain-containing protein [Phycisphaerae bacterium]|nr:winged helix-turn-helix domain-containing protein [Phycisphaerae bacterium]